MPTPLAVRDSRRTAIFINISKLLLFGALVPPVISGLAQQAHVITGIDPATGVATTVSTGAVFAALGALGFGRLADVGVSSRHSRWLWVLIGALVGTPGLLLIATAASLPALVAGWAIAQFGFSGSMSVLRTLLGSALPTHRRRGTVSAVLLGYLGAGVPMAVLFVLPERVWTTSLGLALLGALVTVMALRMTRNEHDGADGADRIDDAHDASLPTAKPNGSLFQRIGILLLQVGVHTVTTTCLSYHALDLAARLQSDGLHDVRASVVVLAGALVGLTLASAFLFWRHELLLRPYSVIVVSGAVMITSLVLRAAPYSLPAVAGSAVLSGVGLGLIASALLTAALGAAPRGLDGRFMGLFSAAGPVGQFIGPLLGLWFLRLIGHTNGDYSAVYFALGVVPLLCSLACIRMAISERNTGTRSQSVLH